MANVTVVGTTYTIFSGNEWHRTEAELVCERFGGILARITNNNIQVCPNV